MNSPMTVMGVSRLAGPRGAAPGVLYSSQSMRSEEPELAVLRGGRPPVTTELGGSAEGP